MLSSERLSWRLSELAEATGLSLPFLRKEARLGKLKTRKLGGAVIALNGDVQSWLTGEKGKVSDQLEANKESYG